MLRIWPSRPVIWCEKLGAEAGGPFPPVPRLYARKRGQPMPGWVFQDFRRIGVTALAEGGFPPHVADKLLCHVSATIRGAAAIYQRSVFAEERRRALDAWAAHMLRHGSGEAPAGNVITLPARVA